MTEFIALLFFAMRAVRSTPMRSILSNATLVPLPPTDYG
jgi:hypothetical protein